MCDTCQTYLGPADLIPFVSFIKTKGHCNHCQTKLSMRYLLLEGLTALAYWLVYMKTGLHIEFLIGASLASILIVIAFIDIDIMIIYDRFQFLIAAIGIILMIMDPTSFNSRLLGLVIVSVPYLILAILTQGIGGGDVKLIAVAGLVLGAWNTVLAFIISTLLGGVYGIWVLLSKKHSPQDAIPFGPYLCIGIFIAYLYGPSIIQFYISLL